MAMTGDFLTPNALVHRNQGGGFGEEIVQWNVESELLMFLESSKCIQTN